MPPNQHVGPPFEGPDQQYAVARKSCQRAAGLWRRIYRGPRSGHPHAKL